MSIWSNLHLIKTGKSRGGPSVTGGPVLCLESRKINDCNLPSLPLLSKQSAQFFSIWSNHHWIKTGKIWEGGGGIGPPGPLSSGGPVLCLESRKIPSLPLLSKQSAQFFSIWHLTGHCSSLPIVFAIVRSLFLLLFSIVWQDQSCMGPCRVPARWRVHWQDCPKNDKKRKKSLYSLLTDSIFSRKHICPPILYKYNILVPMVVLIPLQN